MGPSRLCRCALGHQNKRLRHPLDTPRALVHRSLSNETVRRRCIFLADRTHIGLAGHASGDLYVSPRESPFSGSSFRLRQHLFQAKLPYAVPQSILPCSARAVPWSRGGACHLRLAMLLPKLPKMTFFRLAATTSISLADTRI